MNPSPPEVSDASDEFISVFYRGSAVRRVNAREVLPGSREETRCGTRGRLRFRIARAGRASDERRRCPGDSPSPGFPLSATRSPDAWISGAGEMRTWRSARRRMNGSWANPQYTCCHLHVLSVNWRRSFRRRRGNAVKPAMNRSPAPPARSSSARPAGPIRIPSGRPTSPSPTVPAKRSFLS
jgi:hypothetical protein